MSHVDEGALHAYLDGALDEYPPAEAERIRRLLDEDPEWARRLEIERAVRSEAHGILAQASPTVELPSLEELRAYVKRTRPAPSKISVRMYRMGWAASVVLAVGTGWALRDGQLALSSSEAFQASRSGDAPVETAGVPSVATAADASQQEPAVEEIEGLVAPAAEAATSTRAAAPAEAVQRQVAAAPASPALEAAPTVAEEETQLRDEVVAVGTSSDVVAAAPAPTDAASTDAVESGNVSDLLAPARLADSLLSGAGLPANAFADLGVAEEQKRTEVTEADPEAGAGAASTEVAAAEPEEDESRERRRSDSPVAITSALDQASASRGNASDDDVELEILAPGSIPGLDVVEVANFPAEGTVYLGSHITQRMSDGTLIHVYRLEAEVEPDVLGVLAEGENEAMAQIDEEWVVVRGSRSTEELEEFILLLTPDEG
ncbi:MAG: hypothetical protein AAF389_16935 [Gemmatimonadota bacterium]